MGKLMAIKDHLQGSNISLGCKVIFYGKPSSNIIELTIKDSTLSAEYNDSITSYPYLKSFPTIKESLNIETRK